MAWEPTTLPWGRALQPGESSEAGRFTPTPQPLLSLAAASQCHQQEGPASEPPLGRDKMEVPKHAHSHGDTHTYMGRESRCTHTYWNCSRCHWCLMSRPLQSNQRDPLQKEHGQEAQGHPGCHPALLTKHRTALAS